MKQLLSFLFAFSMAMIFTNQSLARGGGSDHGMQFGASVMNSDQKDVNNYIDSLGVAGTKNLGAGYEFFFDYQYRFSSTMFAIKFRPSYFMQSADGGNVKTSMTGMTFFPMLRVYPLENQFMKFFLQTGVGYGKLSGSLSNSNSGGASTDFTGSAFGAMAGLGAEFCFTDSHCLTIEGNIRYLPIERNLVTGGNGVTDSNLTGNTNGRELETNNNDVGSTMSGLQGAIAYQIYF